MIINSQPCFNKERTKTLLKYVSLDFQRIYDTNYKKITEEKKKIPYCFQTLYTEEHKHLKL